MSGMYSRSGRVKPQSGGSEVAIWYLMRLTGLGLFVLVLSHYLIMHVLYDPKDQDSLWIGIRWNSTFWRGFDWLMLMLVLFHAFMGMRVVISDMSKGTTRTVLLSGLYILAALLFAMGTIVVMTLPAASITAG
jgi:succinate dehydrogenase membrane anchor subunit